MTLRYLMAVDPGVSGAYATFDDWLLEKVARLPVIKVAATKGVKGHSVFQTKEFVEQVRELMIQNKGAHFTALIEKVGTNAMGKAGMISIAKLVAIAHTIEGILITLGWEVIWVPPVTWKYFHGLKGADKDASRKKAKELFPWLKLDTKASCDLAEAVLIGAYGLKKYGD